MDDPTTLADATPADADATPPAGNEPRPQPPTRAADATPADAPRDDDGSISREEARKLRNEANALRRRLKDLEDAQLSEAERLKRDYESVTGERDALARELRAMKARLAAADAGALHPELLADRLSAEALDDPRALKVELERLRQQYPALFRATNGSADGAERGQPVAATADMNALLRHAAGRPA